MKKKAETSDLGNKITSLIIAALCIIVLLGVGEKLYASTLGAKQELKQAEASLNRIKENINIVEKDPSISKEFFIESPNNWMIIEWPFEDDTRIPKKCYEFGYKNCLCLCPSTSLHDVGRYLASCDKKAACTALDKKLITEKTYEYFQVSGNQVKYIIPIEIKGITNLKVSITGNKVESKIKLEKIKI